jgi:hypothetical protein
MELLSRETEKHLLEKILPGLQERKYAETYKKDKSKKIKDKKNKR